VSHMLQHDECTWRVTASSPTCLRIAAPFIVLPVHVNAPEKWRVSSAIEKARRVLHQLFIRNRIPANSSDQKRVE
jgi:hypothetical protein